MEVNWLIFGLLEVTLLEIICLVVLLFLARYKRRLNYEETGLSQLLSEEVKLSPKETKKKKKKLSRYELMLKIFMISIPIIFIGFIAYANFVASHDFNYSYDIGGANDLKKAYLTPANRISDSFNDSFNNSVRNLTANLVYFDVPLTWGADFLNLTMKINKDLFSNSSISIGAKNGPDWSYSSVLAYSAIFPKLKSYSYSQDGNLYLFKISEGLESYSVSNFLANPPKAKIISNMPITINVSDYIIPDYVPGEIDSQVPLRGGHSFYVYVKGDFDLEIWKKDLNSVVGADILNVSLYGLNNSLLFSDIISDDGFAKKTTKSTLQQDKKFSITGLSEGVYRLELKTTDDVIITRMKFNQNKIVIRGRANVFYSTYSADNQDSSNFVIDRALRGNQNIQVYVKGDFSVKVSKRDLNMYAGADRLNISLYDSYGQIVNSKLIPDDGIISVKTNKSYRNTQNLTFSAKNLDEGMYTLKLVSDKSDLIITQLVFNQNKVMFKDSLFLAESGAYFSDLTQNSTVYVRPTKNQDLYFKTSHKEGLQTVKIDKVSLNISAINTNFKYLLKNFDDTYEIFVPKNDITLTGQKFYTFSEDSFFEKQPVNLYFSTKKSCRLATEVMHEANNQIIEVSDINNDFYINSNSKATLKSSKIIPTSEDIYTIKSDLGDVKLSGCGNMAFTPDSWFDPNVQSNLGYKDDLTYLHANADYVLLNYQEPKILNDSVIIFANFNLKDLYINNGKLNVLINAPYLSSNQSKNSSLAIDWIEANVHKNGYFKN